jgi:hypothetical protein
LLATTACAPFVLREPPPGFAVVESYDEHARLKSGDDVGIHVIAFDNVEGGTLAFWSEDLVEKLARRGYVLEKQTPIASRNGVDGTRFDFRYETPTEKLSKFFTAALFVSDKRRVVVQVAGNADLAAEHQARAGEIAEELRVRGCRGRKVCRGPQPASLVGKAPEPAPTAPDEPTPAEPPAPAPEPAPAPAPAPG